MTNPHQPPFSVPDKLLAPREALDPASLLVVRDALPSTLLPRNPFHAANNLDTTSFDLGAALNHEPQVDTGGSMLASAAVPPSGVAPTFSGPQSGSIAQFHGAVLDRRRRDRGGEGGDNRRGASRAYASPWMAEAQDRRDLDRGGDDRRSEPRPYTSPWMARPNGVTDPRPIQPQRTDEPRLIGPIPTVVPHIPLHQETAPAPRHLPEKQQISTPQTITETLPSGDPLGGIFGSAPAVQAAISNPSAWFPASMTSLENAPVVSPPVPATAPVPETLLNPIPETAAVNPAPWSDAVIHPATSTFDRAVPSSASPWADVAPTSLSAGPALAGPDTMTFNRVAAPPSSHLLVDPISVDRHGPLPTRSLAPHIDAAIALPSPLTDAVTGTTQRPGLLLRLGWLFAIPSATGVGIGYLLSILVT